MASERDRRLRHRRREPDRRSGSMSGTVVAISLFGAAAMGALIGVGVPDGVARKTASLVSPAAIATDSPTAVPAGTRFSLCPRGGGTNCVVDGDTAWIDGEKIRVADIDAPETHPPRCTYEAELGDRATSRLAELLNAGSFELKAIDRDTDRYGRKLRVLVRDGRSLGDQLVAEGLARTWDGRRHPWCP
jgi:micrococcal nuclease